MDNKRELTTGQRVRRAVFGTAGLTSFWGALGILRFFIEGEADYATWVWLSVLPFAVANWVAVFRPGVESLKLYLPSFAGTAVILLVGWRQADNWPPLTLHFMAIVFAFAIALVSYIWVKRRYYEWRAERRKRWTRKEWREYRLQQEAKAERSRVRSQAATRYAGPLILACLAALIGGMALLISALMP